MPARHLCVIQGNSMMDRMSSSPRQRTRGSSSGNLKIALCLLWSEEHYPYTYGPGKNAVD